MTQNLLPYLLDANANSDVIDFKSAREILEAMK